MKNPTAVIVALFAVLIVGCTQNDTPRDEHDAAQACTSIRPPSPETIAALSTGSSEAAGKIRQVLTELADALPARTEANTKVSAAVADAKEILHEMHASTDQHQVAADLVAYDATLDQLREALVPLDDDLAACITLIQRLRPSRPGVPADLATTRAALDSLLHDDNIPFSEAEYDCLIDDFARSGGVDLLSNNLPAAGEALRSALTRCVTPNRLEQLDINV